LALSIAEKSAAVTLYSTPIVSLVLAERVKQSALARPRGTHNVLFIKKAGLHLNRWSDKLHVPFAEHAHSR